MQNARNKKRPSPMTRRKKRSRQKNTAKRRDTYDSGQVYSNDIGDVDVNDVLANVEVRGTRSKRLPMSKLFHNLQQPVWGERIGCLLYTSDAADE